MPTDADFAALEAGRTSHPCTPELVGDGVALAGPRKVSWRDARPVFGQDAVTTSAPLVMLAGRWQLPAALHRAARSLTVVFEVDGHRFERLADVLVDSWDYRREGVSEFDDVDGDAGDEGDDDPDVSSLGGCFTADVGWLLRRPSRPTRLEVRARVGPYESAPLSIELLP